MAFNLGNGDDDPVLADINVTPLVDVMLVLLIIFMISAPMLHQGIEVRLPTAEARRIPLDVDDPIVLSVNRDGLVYLGETPIHPTQLVDRLLPRVQARADGTVFIKGDADVPYGKVVEVLDLLQRGGVVNVGMVTQPADKRRGR